MLGAQISRRDVPSQSGTRCPEPPTYRWHPDAICTTSIGIVSYLYLTFSF